MDVDEGKDVTLDTIATADNKAGNGIPVDSDSDDSDDDSEDSTDCNLPEREVEVDVIPLPSDYDGHIQRITRLRERRDLETLQEAREYMSANFPLSQGLWLDWINDERGSDKSSTPDGRTALVHLFDRAVQDYLSVDVWLEYVHFTIGYMAEPDGSIEKVRSVFERALMAAGLHVTKGALLWESYREFELIILSNLPNSEEENAELADQLKRVANLFKRQLSVPLLNMDKTYASFEEWLEEKKSIWTNASGKPECALVEKNNVDLVFKKALERLHQIQPYEDILESCEENAKVNHYKEYLKFEQSLGEPVRLLCLFERALSDCPLDAPLWVGYIEFCDGIGDAEKTLQVCQRSVRNCPWFSLLWQQYIRCVEKCSKPHKEIKGVLEEALKAGIQSAEDFRNLWLEYCSYLRRRIDWGSESEESLLLELRNTIQAAVDHLEQYFGEAGDPSCQLLRFMASVDAVHSRKMDEARKTWNDILNRGHKSLAASWLQFIQLEMAYGDSKHLRKLFPRALQSSKDWPESIVEEWIQFERVEGTLDSYEEALFKCRSRIKQVTAEREKASAEEASTKQNSKQKQDKKLTKVMSNPGESVVREKRQPSTKRRFGEETKERSLEDQKGMTKKPKLELSSEDLGVVSAHDPSKDNRTVFVSNLDFSTTSDQIKEVFSSAGTITELRLVKDFKGRSKGFCYVVLSSFEEMNEALKKDRVPIDGRPMFVSQCNPDKETRQHGFKYRTTLEKNKLFVKGLPLSTTKNDLEKLFSEHGSLRDVRLVTYRNGHSKGMAYVDFADEVSAARALVKVDGMIIGDKTISVALSNPSDRRTSLLSDQPEPSKFAQSLGGGARVRGGGRTQVAFVPRALQVKTDDSKSERNTSVNSSSAPKSNADFRKLLQK